MKIINYSRILSERRLTTDELVDLLQNFEAHQNSSEIKLSTVPLENPLSGDFYFINRNSLLYLQDKLTYKKTKSDKLASSREYLKLNKQKVAQCVYYKADNGLQRRVYSLIGEGDSPTLVHYFGDRPQELKVIDINPQVIEPNVKSSITIVFSTNFKLTDFTVRSVINHKCSLIAPNVIKVHDLVLAPGSQSLAIFQQNTELASFSLKVKANYCYLIASFSQYQLLDLLNTRLTFLKRLYPVASLDDTKEDYYYFFLTSLMNNVPSNKLALELESHDDYGYCIPHYLAALGKYSCLRKIIKLISPFICSSEGLSPYEVSAIFWNLVLF